MRPVVAISEANTMAEFQAVAKTGDIPEGEGRALEVSGRMVAVFLKAGHYHATNDSCPHMGASLATGWVEDDQVTCPWHAWRFCITDGTWLDNPQSELKSDCYEVRVVEDEIQVLVPGRPEPEPDASASDE